MDSQLPHVLTKIQACPNFRTLYALEKSFNQVGLTIQHTPQNWMVLCKIYDGKPLASEVIDDFIFVGKLEDQTRSLPSDVRDKIVDFIQDAASEASTISDNGRIWRDGIQIYDKALLVVNEDVKKIAQTIMD